MAESNFESLPPIEARERTFAQDCVELTNILGVEQLALDFDFNQDPEILLADLTELVDIGIVDPDCAPEKNIQRVIANVALLTFYERIPSYDITGEKYSVTVDGIADHLDEEISKKMVFFQKLEDVANISLEEHFELFPTHHDEITRLRNDSLNAAVGQLNLDFSKNTSDPQGSFLRVPPTEGVDQNCVYFTAVTMSTALRMGIPKKDVKMFLAGYHGGALINNFPYSGYFGVMDPYSPKLSVVSSYSSVPADKVFSTSNIPDYPTYGAFFKDSDHNPLVFLKEPFNSSSISFLSPEDGLLAAEFALLGQHAYQNGDKNLAKHYLTKAMQFDPNNSFAQHLSQRV